MTKEESQLEIKTDLSLEQVKHRIQDIMIGVSERQTQYHHKWIGQIKGDQAEFSSIYAGRTVIYYNLFFYLEQNGTGIRLTNTIYQNRQITIGLLKGLGFSLGGLPLMLSIAFYDGLSGLIITACISALIITLSALAKARPLTQDEFLKDREVKLLMKTIKGYCQN